MQNKTFLPFTGGCFRPHIRESAEHMFAERASKLRGKSQPKLLVEPCELSRWRIKVRLMRLFKHLKSSAWFLTCGYPHPSVIAIDSACRNSCLNCFLETSKLRSFSRQFPNGGLVSKRILEGARGELDLGLIPPPAPTRTVAAEMLDGGIA